MEKESMKWLKNYYHKRDDNEYEYFKYINKNDRKSF